VVAFYFFFNVFVFVCEIFGTAEANRTFRFQAAHTSPPYPQGIEVSCSNFFFQFGPLKLSFPTEYCRFELGIELQERAGHLLLLLLLDNPKIQLHFTIKATADLKFTELSSGAIVLDWLRVHLGWGGEGGVLCWSTS